MTVTADGWLTLSQLNGLLRDLVAEWSELQGEVALLAEISEIRRGPTGHYYLKLVEKREKEVVAQLDAVIWVGSAPTVAQFQRVTGVAPAAGMQVLMRGRVTFHERYGLKFEIRMLDPTYTLGEMQRQKREVLEQLAREGLLERNRLVPLPLVPQRVAVVASLESAGFQDFVDQLTKNVYGYAFHITPYAAVVQGDGAEASIEAAFRRVSHAANRHDVVVLIRGGGSQVDLSCFDTYGVGAAIATCPLPVITGIGHERDETVADMVAYRRAKTPTAAAEVLLDTVRAFEERVEAAADGLRKESRELLVPLEPELNDLRARLTAAGRAVLIRGANRLHQAISSMAGRTMAAFRQHAAALESTARSFYQAHAAFLSRSQTTLESRAVMLRLHGRSLIRTAEHQLRQMERALEHLDPKKVLARGFSITRLEGRLVRRASDVPVGAVVHTTLAEGYLTSTVTTAEVVGEEG